MKKIAGVVPAGILDQHVAVLGKTGSGKTSTAKLLVEQVVAEGARVCILDPIKSDWWGLTSSADGKQAGLPFHILGGPRGHVPLHADAGKAIAEIVANASLPLSIIDMADFEPGGQAKFFTEFAPALLRKMRGVVYLVMEEAHLFAPKERSGVGVETLSIHWAKMLATAGRSKGVRLVLVTQRTQALHNALLGSCDTMIAHRLTAPADQKPVIDWLKANTSKEILEQVSTTIASLKTGDAWLCSGEAKRFEVMHFPRIHTFDNSATPTGDGDTRVIKTAPVDQEKLRAIIGDAVDQAKADDPKELKRRLAELQKESIGPDIVKCPGCGKAPRTPGLILPYSCPHCKSGVLKWVGISEATPAAAKAIEKPALTDADRALIEKLAIQVAGLHLHVQEVVRDARKACEATVTAAVNDFNMLMTEVAFGEAEKLATLLEKASVKKLIEKLNGLSVTPLCPAAPVRGHNQSTRPAVSTNRTPTATSSAPSAPRTPPTGDGDPSVGKSGLRRMLIALAQRNGLTRRQLGVRARVSSQGGSFDTYVSKGRTNGWIVSGDGRFEITEAGVAALGSYEPLPTGQALLQHYLRELGTSGAARMLQALANVYPNKLSRQDLGEASNVSPAGGSFDTYVSKLRTLELIEGDRNALSASPEFFEGEGR